MPSSAQRSSASYQLTMIRGRRPSGSGTRSGPCSSGAPWSRGSSGRCSATSRDRTRRSARGTRAGSTGASGLLHLLDGVVAEVVCGRILLHPALHLDHPLTALAARALGGVGGLLALGGGGRDLPVAAQLEAPLVANAAPPDMARGVASAGIAGAERVMLPARRRGRSRRGRSPR